MHRQIFDDIEDAALPSMERMSELIGMIYDCAIDPQRWEGTLDAVRLQFNFMSAYLELYFLPAGPGYLFATSGVATIPPNVVEKYLPHIFALWGGPERIQQYPLEEPVVQSQVTNPATWPENPYIKDMIQPIGGIDAVSIPLIRDPGMIGTTTFGRHRSAGPVRHSDVAGLRLLAPHFARSVVIGRALDLKAIEASTFASTLDALSAGVILVDGKGMVVHSNPVAAAMLAAGDPIRLIEGRLATTSDVGTAALMNCLAHIVTDETRLERKGMAIPARARNGEANLIHVLPLRQGSIRPGLIQRAIAAVFISATTAPLRLPSDAMPLLYNLTPAETRIFELIAEGHKLKDIAATLGLSGSTIKTHLLRIFEKTGAHRQADLIKLAARISLPI